MKKREKKIKFEAAVAHLKEENLNNVDGMGQFNVSQQNTTNKVIDEYSNDIKV